MSVSEEEVVLNNTPRLADQQFPASEHRIRKMESLKVTEFPATGVFKNSQGSRHSRIKLPRLSTHVNSRS